MNDQELAWMLAVKDGDRRAFENLYHHYKNSMAGFLYRQGCPASAVEDLLQEIFIRVWKGARTFRAEAKVSTYLFRIAFNVWATEGRRKLTVRFTSELPDPPVAAPDPLRTEELGQEIARALAALTDGERAVFLLSEHHGFRYADISEILGIPVGTVKSRMSGAIRKLRELLSSRMD